MSGRVFCSGANCSKYIDGDGITAATRYFCKEHSEHAPKRTAEEDVAWEKTVKEMTEYNDEDISTRRDAWSLRKASARRSRVDDGRTSHGNGANVRAGFEVPDDGSGLDVRSATGPTDEKRRIMRQYEASGLGFCNRCAGNNIKTLDDACKHPTVRNLLFGLYAYSEITLSESLKLLDEVHRAPWDRPNQSSAGCQAKDRLTARLEAAAVSKRREELKAQGKGGRPPKYSDHAARQRDYRRRVSSRSPIGIEASVAALDSVTRGQYLSDAPTGRGLLGQIFNHEGNEHNETF